MTHEFDKEYWENHWAPAGAREGHIPPAHPYLATETAHLPAGTALDAGCGAGAEALWLAEQGWRVTGADISATALATAASRAATAGVDGRIEWVEADLTRWDPGRTWDLVVTSYAHPETDQLAFYRRIASWVAPGGTLLIVAHLHAPGSVSGHSHADGHDSGSDDDHVPPESATATLSGIAELFSRSAWSVETSYENTRTTGSGHGPRQLRDVIVRARRTS